jgi:hypothetical protein
VKGMWSFFLLHSLWSKLKQMVYLLDVHEWFGSWCQSGPKEVYYTPVSLKFMENFVLLDAALVALWSGKQLFNSTVFLRWRTLFASAPKLAKTPGATIANEGSWSRQDTIYATRKPFIIRCEKMILRYNIHLRSNLHKLTNAASTGNETPASDAICSRFIGPRRKVSRGNRQVL